MNPGQPKGEQSNLSLPELSLEAPKSENTPSRPEMDYQIPKLSSQPLVGNISAASPLMPGPAISSDLSVKPVAKDTVLAHLPHVAGDLDLMEKEWMIKVKHLLARNRKNPHEQVREVNLIKAAYMKKRFNKELKITDG